MPDFRNIKIEETLGEFNKKVKMSLIGLDGNAFNLMGVFSSNAIKQNWTKDEVDYVINQCKSSDYNNLLRVLIKYTIEDEDDPEVIFHNGNTYRKI